MPSITATPPALVPGTRLDRYVITRPIGQGGMGEVYAAKDTKIGRKVAIKILPKSLMLDKERLRRFENEARAVGSLNHPNILTVYDIGTHQNSPYMVTEFLEGQTLRELMRRGPVAAAAAVEYAAQIAHGLDAAHEKGIIHRDLKPDNLFVTHAKRVKILDFGLAKVSERAKSEEAQTGAPTVEPATRPGMIFGTVGYMSPEQVRADGTEIDHRADIFAFGTVLFEMLTGHRAFQAATDVETLNAVLKEDPFEKLPAPPALDPFLARILRRCLEKSPEERFQSARDLTFDLETVAVLLGATPDPKRAQPAKTASRLPWLIALGCLLSAVLAAGLFIGRGAGSPPPLPIYRQLTFRRGIVSLARFTPDGQTVFYNAAWEGNRFDIFSARVENPEARSLGVSDARILAVSSAGEMAILLRPSYVSHFVNRGTLARMPLFGGMPREIVEDAQQADWSPDGTSLMVVRRVADDNVLEYPMGRAIYRTAGLITYPRVSPRGDLVAFFDHPSSRDNRGSVAVVDGAGRKSILAGEWSNPQGLAWAPDGSEVWFTASKAGETLSLHAVNLDGEVRTVLRVPPNLFLQDISRDGRVLLTSFNEVTSIVGLPPGESKERDLSWLDRVSLYDMSVDGKMLLFQYYGEASGPNYSSYLRRTDGSPAMRLGDGAAVSLSPDGKWVLVVLNDPLRLVLLPTGPGETKLIDFGGIEDHGNYSWLSDSKHLLFTGKEGGRGLRCYVQSIDGGKPRPVTPEGVIGDLLSPDGKYIVVTQQDRKRALYSLAEGRIVPIPGLRDEQEIIRWQADARALFVYRRGETPAKVYRIDLATGREELWRQMSPYDQSGVFRPLRIFLSGDGRSYVYQLRRHLSDLYIVEGLMP